MVPKLCSTPTLLVPRVLSPLHSCSCDPGSIYMQVTKPTVEEAIEFVTHIEQNLQVRGSCADACSDCLAVHCMSVLIILY